MADPNRKINLNLPSDDEDSDEPELDPSEISLVKEFEEEFKDRFTESDTNFSDFCQQKPKPPPIVFPFDCRGGHRGGHRGGRFQHYGNRQNFDNRRHRYDGQRYSHDGPRNNHDGQRYNNYNNYNRNRDHQQHSTQPPHKRPRDDNQGGSGAP